MCIRDSNILPFFEANPDIDAVLAVNEIFAIHAMGMVQKMGKKVPKDICFIGFTNGMMARYSTPKLTSVDQHGQRMGETAAEMLIEKVESENTEDQEEVFRTEVIKATIIERGSTIN